MPKSQHDQQPGGGWSHWLVCVCVALILWIPGQEGWQDGSEERLCWEVDDVSRPTDLSCFALVNRFHRILFRIPRRPRHKDRVALQRAPFNDAWRHGALINRLWFSNWIYLNPHRTPSPSATSSVAVFAIFPRSIVNRRMKREKGGWKNKSCRFSFFRAQHAIEVRYLT